MSPCQTEHLQARKLVMRQSAVNCGSGRRDRVSRRPFISLTELSIMSLVINSTRLASYTSVWR